MELIPHEKLKCMSAMISGAISFYETDGDMIIQGLKRQQKDGLITGMETMGAHSTGYAVNWMPSSEKPTKMKKPEHLPQHSGNASQ